MAANLALMCSLISGASAAAGQSNPSTPTPTPPPSPPAFSQPHVEQPRDTFAVLDLMALDRSADHLRRTYESAAMFARCAAHLGKRDVQRLLVQAPGTSAETHIARRLTGRFRVCSVGITAVPVPLLRGALAEAMIVRQGALPAEGAAQTLDAARYRDFEQESGPAVDNGGASQSTLRRVARCQVIFGPGLTREMLSQKSGSKAEEVALRKLYATVPVCGGQELPKRIPIALQRAALAEALYHWFETAPRAGKRADLTFRVDHAQA